MRAGRVFVLIVIAFLPAAVAGAGGPPLDPQIRLLNPRDGFVPVAEVVTPQGAVIDTFRSGDVTIKVIGSAGSSIRAQRIAADHAGRAGVAIELAASRPKHLDKAEAYARSGRTVVGDLVALGMPEDDARLQFGDMEVLDPEAASETRLLASTSVGWESLAALATATTSPTKPWDTQCASVSYQNGLIEGFGCSTLFLVAASGGDWWFNNKYKFSARSKDGTNWFCFPTMCPWRLFQVGWSLGWSTNNVVYDWDPSSTLSQKECSSVSIGATYHGAGISISGTVCPEILQPWNLSARRSGAEWQGIEKGTAWEAAIGIQAVHSPPNAPASSSSSLGLIWARWNT
jgi:hypothetical protein